MKRIAGIFILLVGLTLLGWIGYNLLIEMQPAAEGQNPAGPLLIGFGSVYVGQKWLRGV